MRIKGLPPVGWWRCIGKGSGKKMEEKFLLTAAAPTRFSSWAKAMKFID
jgi:hypothetical protein